MSILLDNCVPRRYLRLLHEWGFNAHLSNVYIPEDADDKDVIALAVQRDAALLTVDMDFANILEYPPASHQGIIVLRYQTEEEADLDAALNTTLADLYRDELRQSLVIVSPGRYRVRR
ncbi:MAG: DUF5615 family PIN-like protein [Burkholderiales bacterium]|nr:DUF5615 family PIN-like protein [Anaerolineae bacterium]